MQHSVALYLVFAIWLATYRQTNNQITLPTMCMVRVNNGCFELVKVFMDDSINQNNEVISEIVAKINLTYNISTCKYYLCLHPLLIANGAGSWLCRLKFLLHLLSAGSVISLLCYSVVVCVEGFCNFGSYRK